MSSFISSLTTTTTTSSAPTSTAKKILNDQTWIYPPIGLDAPPVGLTSAIGPVRYGDSMMLEWSPATEKPLTYLVCFAESWKGTNIKIADAGEISSPFNYTYAVVATQNSDTDRVFCHFTFQSSTDLATATFNNTVTWEYINTPLGDAQTWSASGKANSYSPKSSSMASSSTASSSLASTTSSSTLTPNIKSSSGLSTGAKAGLGVGVALAVIALISVALLFLRRRRKAAYAPTATHELYSEPMDQKANSYDYYETEMKEPAVEPVELDAESAAHELPVKHTDVVHELGHNSRQFKTSSIEKRI